MTVIFNKSIDALNSLANVLQHLPGKDIYTAPCPALSNASIGQHTRHIIELYQCLVTGYPTGTINYDDRKRDELYENDRDAVIAEINWITEKLVQPDKELAILCKADDDTVSIQSNYYREVLYNLEHCIHHQALIKVALLSIKGFMVDETFGVAPSTLQYRQQCAQ